MRECWNCAASEPDAHRFCARCGQPLVPTPAEQERLAVALRYLLREADRWDWMPPAPRTALREEYSRRLARLQAGAGKSRVDTPEIRPAQVPVAAPATPDVPPSRSLPRLPAPEPPPAVAADAPPAPVGAFSAFLEEANIRWILILGGLLLASAGIGLLYSQWTAHGRQIVALALLLAPVASFTAAVRLRPTLPVSSRILAAVGGLLLPTGLVAARLFELGGLQVPWPQWNLFAFTASALVLLILAGVLEEAFCLYLGTLALAGAAGALADLSGQPPVFGLACLAAATAYVVRGRRQDRFAPHFFGLGQALAAVGLLSTLPNFVSPASGPPIPALVLLFLGALFFSGSGYLVGRPGAVLASAPVALAALGLCILVYDMPAVTGGFGVLALGTGYLAGARALRQQPNLAASDELASLSYTLGTALTGIALLVLLGTQVLHGILDDFATVPVDELLLGTVVALLAAALYTATAFLFAAPRLMYAATTCLAWSWFLAAVLLHRGTPGYYPGDLSVLALLGVAAAWPLRGLVRDPYLRPLVESCLLLASLPGPLTLAMRALGAPGAHDATPWTLVLVAATFLLATPWLRAGWPLYFGIGWGATAYATTLPLLLDALGYPSEPLNLGFAFLPLLAALGALSPPLQSRFGHAYATPVSRVALGVALLFTLAQIPPEGELPRGLAALTLALYAVGFAALAWPYREWRFLDTSAGDLLAHLGAFTAAAAVWVWTGDGTGESHAALLALSFAGLGAGRILPGMPARALTHVALAVSVLVVLGGPGATDTPWLRTLFAYGPGLVWLLRARTQPAPEPGVAMSTLVYLGGAMGLGSAGLEGEPGVCLLLMAAAVWGFSSPARRFRWPAVPAWASSLLGWSALLHLVHVAGDDRVVGWWLYCAALAALVGTLRKRDEPIQDWAEGLLDVTAVLVLGRAAFASASTFLATDLLLAAALLGAGWRRPSTAYFLVGWGLLALAPLHWELALATDGPNLGRAALALALQIAAGAAATRLARSTGLPGLATAIPYAARATSLLAMALAVPSATDTNWTWSLAGLLALACALATQATLLPSRTDWHMAGLALYGSWGILMDRHDVTMVEAWLAPPALWLLFWGERYRGEGQRFLAEALAASGAILLLAPSLLTSVQGMDHLVFLVVASLGLLLHGIGRRQRVHAVAGSVALLLEMALQALRLAVLVPWWYVALASGLLLVGLGILFERRRRHILTAGSQILSEVARW